MQQKPWRRNTAPTTLKKISEQLQGLENMQDALQNPVTYEKRYVKNRISNLCAILFKT